MVGFSGVRALSPESARAAWASTDEREMARRLDSIVRSSLDAISDMPLKVTDEDCMQKLDELKTEAEPTKRRQQKAAALRKLRAEGRV